jgi:hypothetical protein
MRRTASETAGGLSLLGYRHRSPLVRPYSRSTLPDGGYDVGLSRSIWPMARRFQKHEARQRNPPEAYPRRDPGIWRSLSGHPHRTRRSFA